MGDFARRLCSLCTVVIDEDRLGVSPDARRSCVMGRGVLPESFGDNDQRADDKENDR